MSAQGVDAPAPQVLKIELPRRFAFLLELHPYKVAHGGRNGLKSWSFADAILALGANQQLRIVCGREVMKSLADSVHKLLSDRIKVLGLESFYSVLENKIRGRNGTEISYAGLSTQTDESIKSFEGVDIFWAEEAQSISDSSWAKLLPTIRKENSEVWVSFNPDMADDATYRRFVTNPPPGAVVVKTTWEYAKACGYFTEKMEQLRLHDLQTLPRADYENIWEGTPRVAIAGAIYGREVIEAMEQGRIRPMPYDPRLPVHTIWDLGWNDAMTIIMVQKPVPSAVCVINYLEDSFKRYDQFVKDLNGLGYNWGTDYLPHDGGNADPKTGVSAKVILERLGRRNVVVMSRGDVDDGIRNARMMFPRVYFDDSVRQRATGYLGGGRLLECLKRYRRKVPKTTGEPGTPHHDEFSHGADAFRGLANIVDQITNEGEMPPIEILPAFENPDAGMGTLG